MSNNINKCMFDGNLTRDPELTTFKTGARVCRFAIALNRYLKENEKRTEYIECEAWNEKADRLNELKKGDWVFVETEYKLEKWEKEGEKRSTPRFTVNYFRDAKKSGKKRESTPTPSPELETSLVGGETDNSNGQNIPF